MNKNPSENPRNESCLYDAILEAENKIKEQGTEHDLKAFNHIMEVGICSLNMSISEHLNDSESIVKDCLGSSNGRLRLLVGNAYLLKNDRSTVEKDNCSILLHLWPHLMRGYKLTKQEAALSKKSRVDFLAVNQKTGLPVVIECKSGLSDGLANRGFKQLDRYKQEIIDSGAKGCETILISDDGRSCGDHFGMSWSDFGIKNGYGIVGAACSERIADEASIKLNKKVKDIHGHKAYHWSVIKRLYDDGLLTNEGCI